jgi:hypothetical protein
MSDVMYPNMSKQDRIKLMEKQCLRPEITDYTRTLNENEMGVERFDFTNDAQEVSNLKAELKEVTTDFKSRIKTIETRQEARLKVINTGKRDVNGTLYLFPDQQGGKMRYFDQYGELVKTRPLRNEERQTTLFIGDEGEPLEHKEGNDGAITDVDFTEVKDQPQDTNVTESENQLADIDAGQSATTTVEGTGKTRTKKAKKDADDLNKKVKDMTETVKGRKAKKAAPEAPEVTPETVTGTQEETAGGVAIAEGEQINPDSSGLGAAFDAVGENGTVATDTVVDAPADFEQIPRSETFRDPNDDFWKDSGQENE